MAEGMTLIYLSWCMLAVDYNCKNIHGLQQLIFETAVRNGRCLKTSMAGAAFTASALLRLQAKQEERSKQAQ